MIVTATKIKYTPEEIETIVGHLRAIKNYVIANYVSRMRDYESMSVNYARDELIPGDKSFTFGFAYPGDVWLECNNRVLLFSDNEEDNERSAYINWSDSIVLLRHWHELSEVISDELDARDEERAEVLEFQL